MKRSTMKKENISQAVIRRLPRYYRHLNDLLSNNIRRISSKELSRSIGFTASQIRQDFNHFGEFGQTGYGYNVEDLIQEIGEIIGLNRDYKVAIVGAGHLGTALANYQNFQNMGFVVKGIYDIDEAKIGDHISGIEIQSMDEFVSDVRKKKIDIVYLCTNKNGVQQAVSIIEESNINAIFNFCPVDLKVKEGIVVENINLVDNLLALSYYMKTSHKQ